MQGWATLENLTGQDWKDVDLTLVSGRPVSYKQALYQAYMIDRPSAPLDVGASLTPGVDRGGVALQADKAAKAINRNFAATLREKMVMAATPAPTMLLAAPLNEPVSLSNSAERIAAQDSVTQVSFHIPSPVSLGAGRTLSLPIVDAHEPAQRVAIYEPQTDFSHPLMAAELINDGKAALPPGIVTIYERGALGASYVGDSQLSATPAGDKRLLSFALDLKTTIETSNADSASFVRARIAGGVLVVEEMQRRRTVFLVKASEPRRLVVNVPQTYANARLSEPTTAGVTEANGLFRVPFDVKVGDGQKFVTIVEHMQTREFALANSNETAFDVYVRNGQIDADTRAKLAKLVELRAAQAATERAKAQIQNQIDATTTEQSRLKELLGAAIAGSDLQKRYLKKLDTDETQLEQQNAEYARRVEAAEAAARAVSDYVASL
jgi:hypothetical protein